MIAHIKRVSIGEPGVEEPSIREPEVEEPQEGRVSLVSRTDLLPYLWSEVEEGMMELESTIEEGDDRADCEGTQVCGRETVRPTESAEESDAEAEETD
ncbi:hypothetical protein P8452_61675 [Trifolium repens]|nr:hypothetical protein P8452_61675 [Trifolium repens]